MAELPPSSDADLTELREELVAACDQLAAVLSGASQREQAALDTIRDVVVRVDRTLAAQERAVQTFADATRSLARQLLLCHARFTEWALGDDLTPSR